MNERRAKKMRSPNNRKQWLEERRYGIGGSDAASVLGLSPYKTNVALWEEKTGRKKAEDISEKGYVKYGKEAEKYLRGLFSLDFPQYEIQYDEFKMYSQPGREWLFATLDGVLLDKGTGEKGVVEIKTAEILKAGQYQQWQGKIPQHYYIQVLHQLLATDFSFAVVYALIKFDFEDSPRRELRCYTIRRKEVSDDMDYLLSKETEFWNCVEKNIRPNLILPSI